MMSDRATDLTLEVDGTDASPEKIEPIAFLRAAAAFFELAHKLSEEVRGPHRVPPVRMEGLRIKDKCVAAMTSTSFTPAEARVAGDEIGAMVSGRRRPRHGYRGLVDSLRDAFVELRIGEDRTAKFRAGGDDAEFVELTLPEPQEPRIRAMTSLRCRLVGLLGEGEFTATLRSVFGGKRFSVKIDSKIVEDLRGQLPEGEVDIEVIADVDRNGDLSNVELLEYRVVRRGGRTARDAARRLIGREGDDD